jgi:hypothetical protein
MQLLQLLHLRATDCQLAGRTVSPRVGDRARPLLAIGPQRVFAPVCVLVSRGQGAGCPEGGFMLSVRPGHTRIARKRALSG